MQVSAKNHKEREGRHRKKNKMKWECALTGFLRPPVSDLASSYTKGHSHHLK